MYTYIYATLSKSGSQCAVGVVCDGMQDSACGEPARRHHGSSERLTVRDDDDDSESMELLQLLGLMILIYGFVN